ncbi:hypothetical protein ACFXO8_14585, partial [Nocardia tengchongensis]
MGQQRNRTRGALLRRVAPVGVVALAAAVLGTAATPTGTYAQAAPAAAPVLHIPDQQGPPQTGHLAAAKYLKDHPGAARPRALTVAASPTHENKPHAGDDQARQKHGGG